MKKKILIGISINLINIILLSESYVFSQNPCIIVREGRKKDLVSGFLSSALILSIWLVN